MHDIVGFVITRIFLCANSLRFLNTFPTYPTSAFWPRSCSAQQYEPIDLGEFTMYSTTPEQNFMDAKAPLSEPHFNEEATVLSARPVVPLEKVSSSRNSTRLARPWVLGLGLVGALLIGIFATVVYYSQSDGENLSSFEGVEVAAGAEGTISQPVDSFSGPASTQPQLEAEKPSTSNTKAPVDTGTAKAKANREPAKNPRPRLVATISEPKSNHIEDQTEERRASRRQERRERRRNQRDRRNEKSDDVLRIRDIFEGSPRP